MFLLNDKEVTLMAAKTDAERRYSRIAERMNSFVYKMIVSINKVRIMLLTKQDRIREALSVFLEISRNVAIHLLQRSGY